MNEELPNVLLSVSGDVAKAHGETSDGISWRVYAERDREDRSRCQIYVAGVQVADISVHARRVALTDDTQAICAALVWSAIRSVRLGKYEPCVEVTSYVGELDMALQVLERDGEIAVDDLDARKKDGGRRTDICEVVCVRDPSELRRLWAEGFRPS